MIKNFRNKMTEEIFAGKFPKGFPVSLVKVSRRRLEAVNAAISLQDLKIPLSHKLHPLYEDRIGQHAIWINSKYRVCFVWNSGEALEVEIVDYH